MKAYFENQIELNCKIEVTTVRIESYSYNHYTLLALQNMYSK